jgi:hypothetical protein
MGTKSHETIFGASVRAAAERAAEARITYLDYHLHTSDMPPLT